MPELVVSPADEGERLDSYLASHSRISRSALQRLIEDGCVTVNGSTVRPSHKVKPGDMIWYSVPPPKPADIIAEELPLDIVYEDDDFLVINKPKGMVVHPAPGAASGTLVNALIAHCKLAAVGGVERPGIVHRLDKDTSGLIVVAKNDAAHHSLQKQIQARTAERKYLALVWGNPRFELAVVDAPIGRHPVDRKKMAVIESPAYRSRVALTDLRVLERFGPMTLIEAGLRTGRTHQVRVHAAYAGHPIVGDPVYSGGRRLKVGRREFMADVNRLIDELHGQALHAYSLSFEHPRTGEQMAFTAPMPEEMESLVTYLRERCGQ
ncbi:MAG TPA: RluA family pseudouridine synthase [Armatimonadota bacterium]|nr:RluA family pseudouridine synthase [Armatimonadota bacterium]